MDSNDNDAAVDDAVDAGEAAMKALTATLPARRKGDPRRRRRDTLRGIPALRGRVRSYVRSVEERAQKSDRKTVLYPAIALRVSLQVLRQWARDRCPQQASSLAFQTVLSVVPLVAVTLAVLRATNALGEQSALVEFLSSNLIPIPEQEISARLLSWSENVTFESLGGAGLVSTVALAFIMINSLEKVANYIWRAERTRSIAQKFVVFYATATVGPALIGYSLYHAADAGLTKGFSGFLFSFATTFSAMWMANYFIPACRVRWKPAIAGALVGTILFEAAKYAFGLYVTEFALERYAGIYGAVAVAPLWLLWVYYSWLTLLLTFEIAHAVQNLYLLEQVDRRSVMSLENELLHRVNGVVAARVMVAIARAYSRGDKVTTRRALETRFDMSPEVLARIIERLREHDLVIEVDGDTRGVLPARPPNQIALATILRAFRGDDVDLDAEASGSRLEKVLTDIEADALQRTAHLYLDQLV
jgi:membrane protein